MSQNTISCEVNKRICQAFGCFAEATTEIEVKIGHEKTMTLDLCNDCISKFRED